MNSFNRIYLLAAGSLSLLLPFAKIEIFNINPVVVPHIPLLGISARGADEAFTEVAGPARFNWQMVLSVIYFGVTIIMVLKLAAKFIWVYRLKMKGQKSRREGFVFIKTDDPRAPFAFMNMLFWPADMQQDCPEEKGILMHELAHIRQHHTVDKIFMQLMLAACWLNPFNWLIKKELWMQHEFLADKYAIKDGNSETFARMLLYSLAGSSFNRSVISPFFQSTVKRRLLMLTHPARSSYSFLRRLLSVPVLLFTAVILLAANTRYSNVIRSKEKIVIVLDAAHGGNDAGGESIYGYQEKDITLAICKKLVSVSGEYNIEIITTRDADVSATLEQRLQRSNSTDAAIFLSVHVKKSPVTDVRANSYELGVNPKGKDSSKSILLASSIANKLKIQKIPVEVVDHGRAYLVSDNKHPALLMECGNMDDADNMALLKDETRTEVLCRNILSGIVDYNISLATK